MCSKTAVAPLDRIKILLQAHSNHYKHFGIFILYIHIYFFMNLYEIIDMSSFIFSGVFSGLKEIIQKEKFLALYKGNFAQMIRIFPYAATQYTSFEIYKKV